MDIYENPADDEGDTISTKLAAKCNPHKTVWLKCKNTAEKALHTIRPPSPMIRDIPHTVTHEENDNDLPKTPLIMAAEKDTDHRKSPVNHREDLPASSPSTPRYDQSVRVNMETVENLDMKDRDPSDMNRHVRVWFEDVLAEPEGMHSFDVVWRYSFITFTSVKFWSYRICSLLCAIPFSVCWGVYFACLTFLHIWYVVPCTKSCLIVLHWASKMWTLCIRTFCDPCYESVSRIFSNVNFTSYRQ